MADSANTQNSSNINALILSFSRNPRRESTDPDQETTTSSDHIVMISFLNQDMMIPSSKDVPLPASKASIEALRKIVICQEHEDGECSICLERWKVGEEVKEMPCKHIYHSDCVEKWLRIHGSCPVCRFKMPVDEEDESKEIERDLSQEEFLMALLRFLTPPNINQENY